MKPSIRLASMILILLISYGCQDGSQDFCSSPPVPGVTVTDASSGSEDGSITVNVAGGVGPFIYNINGGVQQSSPVFAGLAPGSYSLGVRDAEGCIGEVQAVVGEKAPLPEASFVNDIKPIIDANCQVSGCHGDKAGIPTYNSYDNIKAKATQIKARTSAGTMPPASSGKTLTQNQKDLLAAWVDAGAPNN